MIDTWTVVERKMTFDRETRAWTTRERVIATGVTKAQADRLMRGHHERSAYPERAEAQS